MITRKIGKSVIYDYTDETDKKCRFFHKWYYGTFAVPVFGRHERHCLDCSERQYKHKNGTWVSYKIWRKNLTPIQSRDGVIRMPNPGRRGTLREDINTITLINTNGTHLMRLN